MSPVRTENSQQRFCFIGTRGVYDGHPWPPSRDVTVRVAPVHLGGESERTNDHQKEALTSILRSYGMHVALDI